VRDGPNRRIGSLIATAKMNGIEPFAYLKATLEVIVNSHPQSRIDDLPLA
jgi:transposase